MLLRLSLDSLVNSTKGLLRGQCSVLRIGFNGFFGFCYPASVARQDVLETNVHHILVYERDLAMGINVTRPTVLGMWLREESAHMHRTI